MSSRVRGGRAAVGVVLLAGLLAACGAAPSDADVKEAVQRVSGAMEQQVRAAQQTLPVGQTLRLPDGEELTLLSVGGALAGTAPSAGERLVVLEVRLANGGAAPLPLGGEQDFWLSDSNGRRYLPIARPGLPEAVAPGAEARGHLAFSVPEAAPALRFGWQRYPASVFIIS